jgi:hypothetical protein
VQLCIGHQWNPKKAILENLREKIDLTIASGGVFSTNN